MGKKTRFTLELLVVSLVVWLVTVLLFTEEFVFSKPDTSATTSQQAAAPLGDLVDGSFTGTAAGHNGDLNVEVKVEGGEIAEVEVIDHVETAGIADEALEQIPQMIVDSNSTDVEAVSGATVTSNAIMSAVNNALGETSDAKPEEEEETEDESADQEENLASEGFADGTFTGVGQGHEGEVEVKVNVVEGKITDIEVINSSETKGISDPAFDEVPAKIIETNSTDVETVSGATYTSKALIEAVNNALAGDSSEDTVAASDEAAFKDGTYEGVGKGYGGDLKVEVTIAGGVITEIEVLEHGETQGISDAAFDKVPDAIIEANSTEVDVASGASESSKGIISAVEDALKAAQ